MRISGTLTLVKKDASPEREKAPLAGRLSLDLMADQLNLDTEETTALQRYAAGLWDERNAWDVQRRTEPLRPLELEARAWVMRGLKKGGRRNG